MRRYSRRYRRQRRQLGNSVIHVPSTIGSTPGANTSVVFIITSPSILAGESATTGIDDQDKDRTTQVGHHIGILNIDISVRNTTGDGVVEFCVYKVERAATVPALGVHPVPSTAEVLASGMQQECRLQNPGKVFHYSKRTYSIEQPFNHKIKVWPAKYKLSKIKAGDHWILQVFNRGGTAVALDFEGRYKEYE